MAANGRFDPDVFDPEIFDTGKESLDSYDWTGIETRLAADPQAIAEIASRLRDLDRLVEGTGLTNSEKARAKAITTSLLLLVESPQPEWRAIVELLNSPAITAVCNASALAGLAIAVVRLIVG